MEDVATLMPDDSFFSEDTVRRNCKTGALAMPGFVEPPGATSHRNPLRASTLRKWRRGLLPVYSTM